MFSFTVQRHCVCGQTFTVPTSIGMGGPRRCPDCRVRSSVPQRESRPLPLPRAAAEVGVTQLVDEIIADLQDETLPVPAELVRSPSATPGACRYCDHRLADGDQDYCGDRCQALAEASRRTAVTKRMGIFALGERDGWRCGLCGEPVDPGVEWPHRRSPSVDHIVPTSRGGLDVNQNIQITHLGCNSSKGNRV